MSMKLSKHFANMSIAEKNCCITLVASVLLAQTVNYIYNVATF